jgi:hypothetical protein
MLSEIHPGYDQDMLTYRLDPCFSQSHESFALCIDKRRGNLPFASRTTLALQNS